MFFEQCEWIWLEIHIQNQMALIVYHWIDSSTPRPWVKKLSGKTISIQEQITTYGIITICFCCTYVNPNNPNPTLLHWGGRLYVRWPTAAGSRNVTNRLALPMSSILASPVIKPFHVALFPHGNAKEKNTKGFRKFSILHPLQHFACLWSTVTCKHTTWGSWRFAHSELLSPRPRLSIFSGCRLPSCLAVGFATRSTLHPFRPHLQPPPHPSPCFFPPLRINKHHRRNYHQRRDVSARSSECDKWCASVCTWKAHIQTGPVNVYNLFIWHKWTLSWRTFE